MGAVHARPAEPEGEEDVWYRGWEAGWSQEREYYSGEGYVAARGGWDFECRQVSATTWEGLLDAIDDEEDE
jgi:hypothetical protein